MSNLDECKMQQKYFRESLKVICGEHYHQYLATNFEKKQAPEKLRIAGFNLWNIGSAQTKFKDFKIVAKMINQWDIVAAVELLPIIGADFKINSDIFKYQKEVVVKAKEKLTYYKRKVAEHRKKHELKPPGTPKGYYYRRAEQKLAESEVIYQEALVQAEEMKSMVRPAGYLKLLQELQSLNPEAGWSLAITNEKMGDSTLKELSGFYYRRSITKPTKNEYCNDAFQSRDVQGSKVNLARLKEVILTGKLMNRMRLAYREKDLFLIGDLNLSTELINKAIVSFSEIEGIDGWKVLNDELSSISDHSGLKSNYDHVIYHQKETTECFNKDGELGDIHAETLKFTDRPVQEQLGLAKFDVFENGIFDQDSARLMAQEYRKTLVDRKSMNRGKIVPEFTESKLERMEELFFQRVFESQTKEETPFKWLKQLISDHLPIHFACSTQVDDD